ncbi:hypothetical protein [Pseudoflavonifractor phocaeensis]|uniref:hypothetical protein n=1 Tax=Pseudoflavonifractor phocaeensis TaxID=1870988 RepID=UPI00195AEA69|nr:hypothetical protein [Pseudoflavonifractor phocaeensis]
MSIFEKCKTGLEAAAAHEQGQGPADASALTLAEVQETFREVAEDLGIETERDVVDLVKEVRAERAREKSE